MKTSTIQLAFDTADVDRFFDRLEALVVRMEKAATPRDIHMQAGDIDEETAVAISLALGRLHRTRASL